MNVYILSEEYQTTDGAIQTIGVYDHYNTAIEAACERHNTEFSLVNEVTWASGWSDAKEPTRFIVTEWAVQS